MSDAYPEHNYHLFLFTNASLLHYMRLATQLANLVSRSLLIQKLEPHNDIERWRENTVGGLCSVKGPILVCVCV